MKKLLLTMAALLATVGAWAQSGNVSDVYIIKGDRVSELTVNKDYVLFNTCMNGAANWTGFITANDGNGLGYVKKTPANVGLLSPNYVWTLEKSTTDGMYYLKSKSKGTYVNNAGITTNATGQDITIMSWMDAKSAGKNLAGVNSMNHNGTSTANASISADNRLWIIGKGTGANSDNSNWWSTANGNSWGRWQSAQPYAIYEVEQATEVEVTVNARKVGATEPSFYATLSLPIAQSFDIATALPETELVSYVSKNVTLTAEPNQTIDVEYTEVIPFADSYKALNDGDKWVSFFTAQGRMHVFDSKNAAKYPSIDKATFTNLTDNKFWGFICENPLQSSVVKIVNKGAGEERGTLYLTKNANNAPLLFATDETKGSYVTNEWVISKGRLEGTTQYYSIKANGTNEYIQNFQGAGYMTTYEKDGFGDYGSNIKFTSELDTYVTLKERALNAPKNAVHSLNDEAREAVGNSQDNTVSAYKDAINAINDTDNKQGFIQFTDGGYYYLQNYTPAGTGKKTFVLGSENGTTARTFEVTSGAANAENAMDYTNLNAIWKIETNRDAPEYTPGSGDIGVSKTIGRFVTHMNSTNRLVSNGSGAIQSSAGFPLNATGSTLYFVNLGAGQHFIKNKQYNGSGQQAKSMPIKCDDNGNLSRDADGNAHYKNTRETWYGIPVTSIKVTIGATGYATLHLPFGVNLPEQSDLKAYVVSGVSATEATMTEVNCIPADQGVILTGSANTPYTLTINDAAAWDEGVINLLEGSNMHENIDAAAYVLSQPAGKEVGLYKAAMTAGTWLNNDNKAYLPAGVLPSEAKSLSFVFDTETSIKGIDAAKADNSIYDLSGRRVKNAQKGIFIVNGKKVIK